MKSKIAETPKETTLSKVFQFEEGQRIGRQEAFDEVKQLYEDIDLELLFVDIKDKEGNKDKMSDEIMKIYMIFWIEYLKPNLIKRLKELKEAKK